MASQTWRRFPSLTTGQASGRVRHATINEQLDRRWTLSLDTAGTQEISVAGLARGLWRMEISWTVDSADYYYETKLVIP
jgi:hypothetical protein